MNLARRMSAILIGISPLQILSVLCCLVTTTFADEPQTSSIYPQRGHYPAVFCTVTNAYLDTKELVFKYKRDSGSKLAFDNACSANAGIWTMKNVSGASDCWRTYDEGYVFTIYFFHGSNYFHLHYDMMIPLFSHLRNQDEHTRMLLMPSVETSRLKVDAPLQSISNALNVFDIFG